MKQLFTLGITFLALSAQGQLVVQNGATFFIDAGATVTVQGDVTANANIAGTGRLVMRGTALQNLNLNGFSVPNLEIDNASHVAMGTAGRVTNQLIMTAGKLQLGNFNLTMDAASTVTGAAAGRFVETNGTGELRRELTAAGAYTLPVGVGNDFTPVTYNVTGGTYSSAFLGARAVAGGHPNRHPRTTDFLNVYWALNRSGITGATINTVGTYVDPSDVTGVESDLRTMTYDGANWTLGTAQDATANTVTAPMTGNSTQLYAMNRFVLVTPKIFLQGAYNNTTGLMNDLLRNSGAYSANTLPASNVLPSSDPYRNAPYNTAFAHVNNSVPEAVTAPSVFNDLTNPENNIVDWVFVELRNISSPTQAPVVQTRSVLVQRDGDLVDVDGVSPVYFKNVDAGSYAVSVRHRNHNGMSSNPASAISLNLTNTTYDFTTAATTGIFGTANTNYAVQNSRNMLFAGNGNSNANVRYSGAANDKDFILSAGLSGNAATVLSNQYNALDYNMNRVVRYGGAANDKDFLLATPLGGNGSTIRNQSLPN
ncbi:MAG: hypothetical protein MUF62_01455 [Chitinophagaceae bacterium]|nr:hypothetical protein [Chitinophagaceae bacterium]